MPAGLHGIGVSPTSRRADPLSEKDGCKASFGPKGYRLLMSLYQLRVPAKHRRQETVPQPIRVSSGGVGFHVVCTAGRPGPLD